MIGILFAYLIDEWETTRKTDEFETQLNKMKHYLVISLIANLIILLILVSILPNYIELYVMTILFESITKVICSFVFGVFIVQLHFGEFHSANKFLSSKFWIPFSKLSFCLYLVGSPIQIYSITENYSADNFNAMRLVNE